jgi:hypothetical protein
MSSSDEDESGPALQGAIEAGTKPAPNKSAQVHLRIELFPPEFRERAETTSTARPDGDIARPPLAAALRAFP